MKTGQSPLEKIRARKETLRFDAEIQENRISNHLKYVQNNGGKLMLNSITSAIFSSHKDNNPSKPSDSPLSFTDLTLGGVSSLMNGNKGILPLIWNFAQPFVLTWGLKGVKKLIRGMFGKKRS